MCLCLVALATFATQFAFTQPSKSSEVIVLENARVQLTDVRQVAGSQTGVLMEVNVKEGSRVKKGDLVAVLDHRVPSAALDVAAKQAENDVDVRFARTAYEVADAEYRQALAANKLAENTFSEIELEKLRLESERAKLQIEVAEHKLAVTRLEKDQAATVVDTYRVLAPIDGVVSRVTKGVGEAVAAGDSILEIKSTRTVKVEADLPLEYVKDVKVGAAVTVRQNFGPRTSASKGTTPKGRIYFIDVSADSVTKTVRILAEIENSDGALIAGLPATLSIETAAK